MKTPFYYGWVIVFIAALSHFFSGPGQTFSNAIFIDAYIEEFGWSRSTVSAIYSAATLLAGLLLFVVGRFVDRLGSRLMAVVVSLLLGMSAVYNGFVFNAWMLFFGFFLVRLFGQGSMTLIPNALVPQWFIERRGRALSIAAIGGMTGSALLPIINVWLLDAFGWRASWQILGMSVILLYTPVAWLLIRNRPEEMGLVPDGVQKSPVPSGKMRASRPEEDWTFQEAKATRSFWLLLFVVMIPALVNTGITFHMVSIFSMNGLGPTTAATVLSLMALVSFPVTFLAGYLVDRFPVQWMLMFAFFGQFLVICLLMWVDSVGVAIGFGVLWGTMSAFERISLNMVWPTYFGRLHLGRITGISMSAMVVGSALGPLPFGIFFDWFGGYQEILGILLILPMLGLVASGLAKVPVKTNL